MIGLILRLFGACKQRDEFAQHLKHVEPLLYSFFIRAMCAMNSSPGRPNIIVFEYLPIIVYKSGVGFQNIRFMRKEAP